VWDSSKLVGLFALAQVKVRLIGKVPLSTALLTNAGTGIGTDHAGWLATGGADRLLREWVLSRGATLLKGIPIDLGETLGGRLVERQRCPVVEVAAVPSLMSGKLAKNLRNAKRRLARDGVVFGFKGPGSVSQDDLASLYALHALRRAETGDRPIFEDPLRRQFHEELLASADLVGGTSVIIASIGAEVVGVLYGFVWRDTFAFYQIGWHPRFKQVSLGSILVLEAIEECARQGLEKFDFLRGADDYKYRFGATDVVEGSFAVGRSVGLAAIGAMAQIRDRRREDV
jgi:hypothetical protein